MEPPEDDPEAKPFQCPFPACHRAFTELWKLRAHCRAPARSAPGQGGHGEELQQCPKCLAALMPQLPHIGCTGGLAAPRQAAKRRRVAQQRDEVKSNRRCTSAEPPSPETLPLQLDRSISGPGLVLPNPAGLPPPQLSHLGAATRSYPHVTLNPTDLAAACLQAAADDPGAQARVEAAAEAFLQMGQQQVPLPLEALVQTFIGAVMGTVGAQSATAGVRAGSSGGSSVMLGSPQPPPPQPQYCQPAWDPEAGSRGSAAYTMLSPTVTGGASHEGSPPDGDRSYHSGTAYAPQRLMHRQGQQGDRSGAAMLPIRDPRNRSSNIGMWSPEPQQQQQHQHQHQHQHQQNQHQQQQQQQQQEEEVQHGAWGTAAGAPGLLGGLEAWAQQQQLEQQVQALHVQRQQRTQQAVKLEAPPELQRAAGGSAEAALLHAGWMVDGCGDGALGARSGGDITPDMLASWPLVMPETPVSTAAEAASAAPPPSGSILQPTLLPPVVNRIPQLRGASFGHVSPPPMPAADAAADRRFVSLSEPGPASLQLPPKVPTPPARPVSDSEQPPQQAPQQPLNPFQAASMASERFDSPPPLQQPLQGALQRGQARPTLAQQGRLLSSQWSIGGRTLGSFDATNPADVAQLTAALRAGSMRVNSLQAGSCTAEMMTALLGEGWLDGSEAVTLASQPSASAPAVPAASAGV